MITRVLVTSPLYVSRLIHRDGARSNEANSWASGDGNVLVNRREHYNATPAARYCDEAGQEEVRKNRTKGRQKSYYRYANKTYLRKVSTFRNNDTLPEDFGSRPICRARGSRRGARSPGAKVGATTQRRSTQRQRRTRPSDSSERKQNNNYISCQTQKRYVIGVHPIDDVKGGRITAVFIIVVTPDDFYT